MGAVDVYSLEPASGPVLEAEAEEITYVRWGTPTELDDEGRGKVS